MACKVTHIESMFLFSGNKNIWDNSLPTIPQINTFEDKVHTQFKRPAQTQVNMEQ